MYLVYMIDMNKFLLVDLLSGNVYIISIIFMIFLLYSMKMHYTWNNQRMEIKIKIK